MTTRHSSFPAGSTRVAVIAVLVTIAAGAYLLYSYFGARPIQPESGKAVVDPFLEAVRSGKAESAWEGTTAEFKSNLGRENFLKYVDAHPNLKEPLEFYSLQSVMINGVPNHSRKDTLAALPIKMETTRPKRCVWGDRNKLSSTTVG